ncbi:hypothetical protein MFUL124B02_41000 [Myxococcus fulvus 124B02]|nr:hypothetical protein MFUL124B02_41000 [Myxococcus fulvus 124B02]
MLARRPGLLTFSDDFEHKEAEVRDDDCVELMRWAGPRLEGLRRVRGQVCRRPR